MAGAPSTQELIVDAIASRELDVHTALPGRIHKYDPVTQTAEVELMVRRAIEATDGSTAHETLPIIPNVPIGWMASGGFAIQFPMTKGDGVWVMFSESAWAAYRSTGEPGDPGDLRRFDLSYPVAIPICRPVAKTLTPIGANEAVLDVPASNVLRVGGPAAQFVALENKVMQELNKIRTAYNSHTHSVATTGTAAAQTGTAATSSSQISAIAPVAATKLKAE